MKLLSGLTAVCLAAVLAAQLAITAKYLPDVIAYAGYGPLSYMAKKTNPSAFKKDYPPGESIYTDNSAFMSLYVLLNRAGFNPETATKIIVVSGILLSYAAFMLIFSALLPHEGVWLGVIFTLLATSSSVLGLDFARYGAPTDLTSVFLYYNFADFFAAGAIAAACTNRAILSGLLLAVCFIIYPIKALLAGVFFMTSAVVYFRTSTVPARRYAAGLAIAMVVSLFWTWHILGNTGPSVPSSVWYDYTRMMSFHHYPVEMGMFSTTHMENLLPFISLIMLALLYWPGKGKQSETDRIALYAMWALAGITLFGLIVSVIRPLPFLNKMSLHRANGMLAMVALAYIVRGLVRDISTDNILKAAVASCLLIAPMLNDGSFPYALVLLLSLAALPGFYKSDRARFRLVCVTAASSAALLGFYGVNHLLGPWKIPAYTMAGEWKTGIVVALVAIGAALASKRFKYAVPVVAILGLTWSGVHWQLHNIPNSEWLRQAAQYKLAQEWARANTPENTLFMLDPNINSGWRDYSLRPSFGNLREWLFYTWIYTGSDAMFKEGLRRFNEFGLDINHYLRLDPALKGYSMLYQDTEKVYYSMDDARRRRLAEKYGIEYFVMKTSKISQMPNLKKAYENDDFIIFEAKPVSAPGRVDQATEGKR